MAHTRTLTGIIHKPTGEPWAGFALRITLTPAIPTAHAMLPSHALTIATDNTGTYAVDLEVNATYLVEEIGSYNQQSGSATRYPTGSRYTIVMPDGETPVSLEMLRASEIVIPPGQALPDVVQAIADDQAAHEANHANPHQVTAAQLTDFDAEVTASPTVAGHTSALAILDGRADGVDAALVGLDSRLDAAEPLIASNTATLSAHTSELADHEARVTAMQSGNSEAWADFRDKADGPVAPTLDSGQVATVYGAASALQVADGRMGYEPGVSGVKAGYLSAQLSGPVARVGMTFTFTGGSTGGGAAVILLPTANYFHGVDTAAHLIVQPEFTTWQVRTAPGDFVTVFTHTNSPSLETDGREYNVEAEIQGDTASLRCPDGTLHTFSDPAIAANNVGWVTWEPYQFLMETDDFPEIVEIWADSGAQGPRRTSRATNEIVRQATIDLQRKGVRTIYAPATDTTVEITTTMGELTTELRTDFVMPESGMVWIELRMSVSMTGSEIYVGIGLVSDPWTGVAQRANLDGTLIPLCIGGVFSGGAGSQYSVTAVGLTLSGPNAGARFWNSGASAVLSVTPL